jgi:hypothetical protein
MNRFDKPNLWQDFASSLENPGVVDRTLLESVDLTESIVPLLRSSPLAALPVTESSIAATIIGSVVETLISATVIVPALLLLCNLAEQETQLLLAVRQIHDAESLFDTAIQSLADQLHITLPVKQIVNVTYQVEVPTQHGFNNDPIIGSGSFHDVTILKPVSWLWSLGPAVKAYLEFRLATPCTSPDILFGIEMISDRFQTQLCPGPLIIVTQSKYQRDLPQDMVNQYNAKNSDKIYNSHTWDIRTYIANFNKVQKFLNQENGPDFRLYVSQFIAMHIQSVVVTTTRVNMPYADCNLLYIASSNKLKILYANDLKAACNRLNVDDATEHVRSICSYIEQCGHLFLSVYEDDGFTQLLAPDVVYPQKAPYDALNTVTRDDLLLLRPVPLMPSIMRATLQNFKVDESHLFIPRMYASADMSGGTAVLYQTQAGYAMLIRTPSKQVFHLQSMREAACVVVSPVVEPGIRKLRIYSHGTGDVVKLGSNDAFRTLFHLACTVSRKDTGKNDILYVPDADSIPESIPVHIAEHTFLDMQSPYTGPKTSLFIAGMAMIAGAVLSTQTRIVQTSSNNGVLLLMRGPLVLMGLVAAETIQEQIHGVYSDTEYELVTRRGTDLLEYYRMTAYIDRKKAIDAGYRFSASQQEALFELRKILRPEDYAKAEQIFLYRDFVQKNHESIMQAEFSDALYASTNDALKIPVESVHLRQYIEGSSHIPDNMGPHPTPLDISEAKSYKTIFYEAAVGYVEALHYEVTSNYLYLFCKSAGTTISEMDIDVVGVSLAATAGAGYVYLTTRQSPVPAAGVLVPITAGVQAHLRRFDIMPMVSGIVVRTGDNINWLAQGTTDGVYYVAAAVTSVVGTGVNYVWQKTINTTALLAQTVGMYVITAGAVAVAVYRYKRKR